MTTFRQLKPQQRAQMKQMIDELMGINKKAIQICENMKHPYTWQNQFLQAFLKNQRSTEQLSKMLKTFQARQKERSGL
jgi:hypothetical protein